MPAIEGLLLINLGSPDQPATPAVRRYLREFLMDRHMIDMHWTARSLLVHGFIAPTRAPKTARAYQSIWNEKGSPLLHFTKRFTALVAEKEGCAAVEFGMRYGRPSVRSALQRLRAAGVTELRVVPLYPQFAKSSTLTAIECVNHELKRMAWPVSAVYLQDFYDQPAWIGALSQNILKEQESFQADHLLLSYHGLPEHHIRELDKSNEHCLKSANCCDGIGKVNRLCYRAQCFATSRALIAFVRWPKERATVSFQSRLGRRPWIQPFSDRVIIDLAKSGARKVLVSCPSFVADCLETLEEIAIRMKRDFIAAGGADLRLVPAVNDSSSWADGFVAMLERPELIWLNDQQALSLLGR